MNFWYDTEFVEDGITICPVSFAMVSEDERTLYLINKQFMNDFWYGDPHYWKETTLVQPSQWVVDNVLDKIDERDVELYGVNHEEWGDAIYKFLTAKVSSTPIELWGHYAAYDHLVYCQAFGKMIDLPEPLPMFTNDDMTIRGVGKDAQPYPLRFPEIYPEHDALADARYQKLCWEFWTGKHDRI